CRAAQINVQVSKTIGPSFWQVHERMAAPELLQATSTLIDSWIARTNSSRDTAQSSALESSEKLSEQAISFSCGEDQLIGVLHRGSAQIKCGVVGVVAGGPQYRAGAHRQFVSLSRKLAKQGHSVLRFDLRGMGDSNGEHLGYQQSAPDIKAAIDALLINEPHISEVVLFGECESASGILFYAYRDPRVAGIVLVNPWVRTEEGQAQVIIKHYYWERLTSREFWRKIVSGKFNPVTAFKSLVNVLMLYRRGQKANQAATSDVQDADISALPLPQKTAAGFRRFAGAIFVLMSGHDYIAREFDQVVKTSPAWQGLLENPRVTRRDMQGADHTFSREVWKNQAHEWIADWIARRQ
ncbi:MAG TPA: hydrolase 1, exosortase A system-associated, partial [Steroidobacteraceae bacterium]|nr:hydrolase 1, exosortase A system-associated [Steroidobacteraceae bacterium]